MQDILSEAIKAPRTCGHCGDTYKSTNARTNFCPKCYKKTTTCTVEGCGTVFVRQFEGDDRCSEHAPRCMNCRKKCKGGFCDHCASLLKEGYCTACGNVPPEGIIDEFGRCMNCMDDIGAFEDEFTDTGIKLCPHCKARTIKPEEFICEVCLNEKVAY